MLKYLTAGESHGEKLIGILSGIPANLYIDVDYINKQLFRRQKGYGRSERMKIEKDKVEIIAGISKNKTTGNPIGLEIKNKGRNIPLTEVKRPRPGHGDLVGAIKYNQEGGRNILERASARETAMRVAIGSICRILLKELDIHIYSHVVRIGNIASDTNYYKSDSIDFDIAEKSSFRFTNLKKEKDLKKSIKEASLNGDSLGGEIEVIVKGLPVGLGSHRNWDEKLDSKLAASVMSIQGIKSVEIGYGKDSGKTFGSEYHDEIYYENGNYRRNTNNAGGIEAGISNGEDLIIKGVMKPIPTLKKGLVTIDMDSKKEVKTSYERSDICAVPSASIVMESAVAYVLANEVIRIFGGDFIEEISERYKLYLDYIKTR